MLLTRIEHEWTTGKRIFDLPTARFWKPDTGPDGGGVDLSFELLGRPAATPIGISDRLSAAGGKFAINFTNC